MNPEIGDIFIYEKQKWLFTVCDDLIPVIFDFTYNTTIKLKNLNLQSKPAALKAYSTPGILIVSDFNKGDTHILKFN